MEVSVKKNTSRFGDTYFNLVCDGRPITFDITHTHLHTARGIYSEFVVPSPKCLGTLTSKSVAYVEIGDSAKTKSMYVDALINKSSDVYARLQTFKRDLVNQIADAITTSCTVDSTSPLATYVHKHCKSTPVADEINIMFLKCESDDGAYIHLKVTSGTLSYCNNEMVDMDYLMYKSYLMIPHVRIDNVRIPKMRNASNKLNVHMVMVRQDVLPYP